MRLSKEDERQGESSSIETQRKILRAFCLENGFEIREEYVDDGCSGTDIENRPAMQRMLADIKDRKVNLVLCKDLSRLGRNIGDTATLLDKIFPRYRVRFISVTEGTDSEKRDRSLRILTPLHNFTNELYAADISDKIHAALQIKIRNGEYIGSFPPYGYIKDPENKNHLLPDMVTAPVIREIFERGAAGEKPADIAGWLNAGGIMPPSCYRAEKYPSAKTAFPKTDKWTSGAVGKILRNQVYLGHTVQGKTEKPSFKCKVTYSLAREEWIVVKETHEPLISVETWEKARKNVNNRRTKKEGGFRNEFSGIVFCGDCGRHMSTAFSHGKACLVCGGYKAGGVAKCSAHRIDYNRFCEYVKSMLKEVDGSLEDIRRSIDVIKIHEAENGEADIQVVLRRM